jgi:hypothetical protein
VRNRFDTPTPLSSDPAFGEQARRLYRQSGGATPPKESKNIGRLILCRCGGSISIRGIRLYGPG